MKKILLATFLFTGLFTGFPAVAAVEVVPLDIELGYWESTPEMLESDAITKMLASIPEAQRAQVRSMMKSKAMLPITKQCITAESLENFEERFKEAMGDQDGCAFNVIQSSDQEFSGELKCESIATTMRTQVINSKRHVSEATSTAAALGQTKIRVVAEWKSSTCPPGVEP